MFCGNRDEFYPILICLISIHLGAFILSICPCLHIKSDWSKYLVKMRKHIKLWILKAEQYHKQYKIKTHKMCINYFAQLCNSCLHLTECSLVLYKKIILNIFLWWVFSCLFNHDVLNDSIIALGFPRHVISYTDRLVVYDVIPYLWPQTHGFLFVSWHSHKNILHICNCMLCIIKQNLEEWGIYFQISDKKHECFANSFISGAWKNLPSIDF